MIWRPMRRAALTITGPARLMVKSSSFEAARTTQKISAAPVSASCSRDASSSGTRTS